MAMAFLEAAFSNIVAALLLAVVAVGVGLCCRRPALVHVLWVLVLLKLVTPPLVRVPVAWPAPEPAPADLSDAVFLEVAMPEPGESAPPVEAMESSWLSWLAGAWLLGAAGWYVLAARRAGAFGSLLRLARPAPARIIERVERLSRLLGLSRAPRVVEMPGRVAPLVWGASAPVLAVPDGLADSVGEAGLDTILMHELAHIRRGDPWVRLLEQAALGLYWWCPLAWFASRELREAEEQCCDAWVVRMLPGAERAYAAALVDVLDFLSGAAAPPLLASGLGMVADLKRRLAMILKGATPHRLDRPATLALAALAVIVLPLVPAWSSAQAPPPLPKKDVLIVKDAVLQPFRVVFAEVGGDKGLEGELAKKLAEVEALKQRLADAKKAGDKKPDARKPGEKKPGASVRIQIEGMAGEAEAKALADALRKALPGKDVTVRLGGERPGAEARKILIFRKGEPGAGGALELKLMPDGKKGTAPAPGVKKGIEGGAKPAAPVKPTDKPTGKDGADTKGAPGKHGPDDRLKSLEDKLDQLLKELRGGKPGTKSGK